MVGYPGSAFEAKAIANAAWVFDAVYTPIETMFLQNAKAAGAQIISGYELFFFQGVHAWRHFQVLTWMQTNFVQPYDCATVL